MVGHVTAAAFSELHGLFVVDVDVEGKGFGYTTDRRSPDRRIAMFTFSRATWEMHCTHHCFNTINRDI